MALKRQRSSARASADRASTRPSPDRASARCTRARGEHAGGDQLCRLRCHVVPGLFALLDGGDVVRLLATGQEMYSGCLDAAWDWVRRNYERHLKIDAVRLDGLRLGAVVKELHFWEKKVGTYTLSAPLARSFALAALRDFADSEGSTVAAASQLAADLQVFARRELWCCLEDPECESDGENFSGDEVLMACDHDISAYGRVSQKLVGSARLFGYEFALAAECCAEVFSGSFACWEEGSVSCRRRTRAVGKAPAQELLAWSGRSGDAAVDEEDDDHAVTYAPANAIGPLARRLGVDARALTRLVLAVLASPFRLAGPPHAYAFDLDWERRLNALWNSP